MMQGAFLFGPNIKVLSMTGSSRDGLDDTRTIYISTNTIVVLLVVASVENFRMTTVCNSNTQALCNCRTGEPLGHTPLWPCHAIQFNAINSHLATCSAKQLRTTWTHAIYAILLLCLTSHHAIIWIYSHLTHTMSGHKNHLDISNLDYGTPYLGITWRASWAHVMPYHT